MTTTVQDILEQVGGRLEEYWAVSKQDRPACPEREEVEPSIELLAEGYSEANKEEKDRIITLLNRLESDFPSASIAIFNLAAADNNYKLMRVQVDYIRESYPEEMKNLDPDKLIQLQEAAVKEEAAKKSGSGERMRSPKQGSMYSFSGAGSGHALPASQASDDSRETGSPKEKKKTP